MAKTLASRLTRLERHPGRPASWRSPKEMTDEELLRCAGLPSDASDEDIAAFVTRIETDLGGTARNEGTP